MEVEQFRAEATRADYQAAALSFSVGVVRTWYRFAEARRQRRLVEDQIDTTEIEPPQRQGLYPLEHFVVQTPKEDDVPPCVPNSRWFFALNGERTCSN